MVFSSALDWSGCARSASASIEASVATSRLCSKEGSMELGMAILSGRGANCPRGGRSRRVALEREACQREARFATSRGTRMCPADSVPRIGRGPLTGAARGQRGTGICCGNLAIDGTETVHVLSSPAVPVREPLGPLGLEAHGPTGLGQQPGRALRRNPTRGQMLGPKAFAPASGLGTRRGSPVKRPAGRSGRPQASMARTHSMRMDHGARRQKKRIPARRAHGGWAGSFACWSWEAP